MNNVNPTKGFELMANLSSIAAVEFKKNNLAFFKDLESLCLGYQQNWHEENGIIYFSVTSGGATGEEWIARLEAKGFGGVSDYAKSVLRSADFKPTTGITTEVAVLKGMLFEDSERITKNIRKVAGERKLETPNAEIACLIREMFTDKEIAAMGLMWIVAMHEPIKDSGGGPRLLGAVGGDGGRLYACYDGSDSGWFRGSGFAFAVSQVKN